MSQVFNIGLLTNKNLDVTNVLSTSFIEESFFITTLDFISESRNEIREHTKELYKTITEAQSEMVLNESFSDFFMKIKDMINKFLKYIKSLFERFSTLFNKMISSDKYIIKNKELFKKFNSDHEFEIEGYVYNFDPTVPAINALVEFNKDFIEIDFDIMNGKKDNKEYLKYLKSVHGRLSGLLQNGYYDKFRAEVLGLENYEITQGEFSEELFRIFRSGDIKKDTIRITEENLITDVLNIFENYKTLENDIKKTKDKIEKEYKLIEKSIQRLVTRDNDFDMDKAIGIGINPEYDGSSIDGFNVSQEVLNNLNLFIKTKTNQVMEMSSIHAMAFSYKLDAINECYKQDKKILYTALQQIQKDSSLR